MRLLVTAANVSCLAASLFSITARGDFIIGSGSFQPMVGPTAVGPSPRIANPNQSPRPYWDQQSIDTLSPSSGCNVGWVVTGGSLAGCANVEGPIPFTRDDVVPNAYWAQGNGNYDPNFIFHSSATNATELELTATSHGSEEVFGWYTVGGPLSLHPLFNAGDLAVARAHANGTRVEVYGPDIPGNATYGYYLFNGVDTFFTNSALNTVDIGIQHFTLFGAPSTGSNTADQYYIGVEDGAALSDFDYNDMVIHIGTRTRAGGGGGGGGGGGNGGPGFAEVPEPSNVLLLGSALVGMVLIFRRGGLQGNSSRVR